MAGVRRQGRRRDSQRLLARELRQPEIEHLDVAVWPQHHVLGLDVAMDEAPRVGGRERPGHLQHNLDGVLGSATAPL